MQKHWDVFPFLNLFYDRCSSILTEMWIATTTTLNTKDNYIINLTPECKLCKVNSPWLTWNTYNIWLEAADC